MRTNIYMLMCLSSLASAYVSAAEAAKAVQAGGDKNYVPEDPNLIAASDMAQPGETVVLEFDAPKKGNYEFFCSYPGHSQMMRGYLFVK